MRLGEEDEPSTSRNYAPYVPIERKDGLFGYEKDRVTAPWAKRRYSLSIEGLHEEIIDVYNWLKPSPLEKAIRFKVYERVHDVISNKWVDQNVKVSVFGSLRTQLFLPTSDIDVLVECSDWGTDIISALQGTADALGHSGMAETISVYGEAFVPIIKMVDKDTRVSIDISFNTVQGVKAADYIERVKEEFPVVEPLVLILKQFLIQRSLNQTYTGGLSSYGLILMLISFLQLYGMSVRRKSIYMNGVNLGELLMRFFEVYSQEFNYLEVGISVFSCCYKKKSAMPGEVEAILSLEDPLLPTNEVGRSTFNFVGIQSAFAQALQVLKGVFVNDRRKSNLFSKIYGGSMLQMIMPFTPQQIQYRNWLKVSNKSFSMTYPGDVVRCSHMLTNTFLAPVVNIDKVDWHSIVFAPKHAKRVPIPIVEEKSGVKDNDGSPERPERNKISKKNHSSDVQSEHSPNENINVVYEKRQPPNKKGHFKRNKPTEFYNDLPSIRNGINALTVDVQSVPAQESQSPSLKENCDSKPYPQNNVFTNSNRNLNNNNNNNSSNNNNNLYQYRSRNAPAPNNKYKKPKKGDRRKSEYRLDDQQNPRLIGEPTILYNNVNGGMSAGAITECLKISDGDNSEQGSVKSVCI